MKIKANFKEAPGNKILTISGLGGVGKTSLALQFAHQEQVLEVYPGGVYWITADTEKSENTAKKLPAHWAVFEFWHHLNWF